MSLNNNNSTRQFSSVTSIDGQGLTNTLVPLSAESSHSSEDEHLLRFGGGTNDSEKLEETQELDMDYYGNDSRKDEEVMDEIYSGINLVSSQFNESDDPDSPLFLNNSQFDDSARFDHHSQFDYSQQHFSASQQIDLQDSSSSSSDEFLLSVSQSTSTSRQGSLLGANLKRSDSSGSQLDDASEGEGSKPKQQRAPIVRKKSGGLSDWQSQKDLGPKTKVQRSTVD